MAKQNGYYHSLSRRFAKHDKDVFNRTNKRYLWTSKNDTTMVKATVNLDKFVVYEVINYMHKALEKHGIKDNHIALFGSFHNGNPHADNRVIIFST